VATLPHAVHALPAARVGQHHMLLALILEPRHPLGPFRVADHVGAIQHQHTELAADQGLATRSLSSSTSL